MLICLFCILHKNLNKRNLEEYLLLGVFHASYENKNYTFDAYLSQTNSSHASSYLSISSVWVEID